MSLSEREKFVGIEFQKKLDQISNRNHACCKWKIEENQENILDYLDSIIKDQIIFDGFTNKSIEFLDLRTKIVNQIIQICNNFKLKNETLFKTVQIFDLYCWKISNFRSFSSKNIVGSKIDDSSLEDRKFFHDPAASTKTTNSYHREMLRELKIIIVLCLNIACKLEEINCNYINYFKENLLDDVDQNDLFDMKDLIKHELEILKKINFKISAPSFYVFNNVYLQLLIKETFRTYNKLGFDQTHIMVMYLIKINDVILKEYCTLHESVYISPLYSGMICIKATLLQFEDMYSSILSNLSKYLSHFINSSSFEIDTDFIDLVSARLFALIKSKNLKFSN
jgi:hypothetical protein